MRNCTAKELLILLVQISFVLWWQILFIWVRRLELIENLKVFHFLVVVSWDVHQRIEIELLEFK